MEKERVCNFPFVSPVFIADDMVVFENKIGIIRQCFSGGTIKVTLHDFEESTQRLQIFKQGERIMVAPGIELEYQGKNNKRGDAQFTALSQNPLEISFRPCPDKQLKKLIRP